jgi:uncharacterized membrane protein YidH (DUF202 family)
MKRSSPEPAVLAQSFQSLVDWGLLSSDALRSSAELAVSRDMELERLLRYEHGITRRKLLEALAEYYQCGWVEYDERLPVPPELLIGLDAEKLCTALWFPVARDGTAVIVAVRDPLDPGLREDIQSTIKAEEFQYRVALAEDIASLIQDFLNGPPGGLSGNERTDLAFWRNIMARWRTKLACYRTDFAKVRTHLSLLRGGLMLVTIGNTLLRADSAPARAPLYWLIIATGFFPLFLGLFSYYRIKESIFRPPRHQTIVEVTATSVSFLESYQFVDREAPNGLGRSTMLARLSDMVHNTSISMHASADNKTRSALAHERNLFAAQRTIAGCYRTIYARARTGLSFIRTGVSFASIGLGLISYFGLSMLNILDGFIILAGLLMAVDGIIWSWPVRKEHYEALKCSVSF